MRRPVGVTVAASILGIIALLGLFGMVFSFAAMFLMHNPAAHNPAVPQPAGVRAVVGGVDLGFVCFFAFCLWTAVGLFRMRRWARCSVVAIGILILITCGFISALMFTLRHFAPAAKALSPAQSGIVSIVLVAFGVFYAAAALIGLWWAVYFNRKHVRLAFAGGAGAVIEGHVSASGEYDLWRGVVIAFACLILLGALAMLGMAWSRMPLLLLGILFRGHGAIIVDLVFAAVQLFIGVGLLVRLRPAYWTAVGWQIFGVLSVALFLIPGYTARVLAVGNEASRRFMMPSQLNQSTMLHMQQQFFVPIAVLSLVIMLVFLYALWRCRRWYLQDYPVIDPA